MTILQGIIPNNFNGRVLCQFIACSLGTLANFGSSQNNIWPSAILPKLRANDSSIPITNVEETWITSLFLGMEPIGAAAGIYTMLKVGSKNTVLLSSIPNSISLLLLAFSNSTILLYLSRIIGCFGDAFIFIGVPAYIGEIAEPSYRGGLTTLLMLMFNIGCVHTYYFGFVLSIQTFAFTALGCVIIQVALFFFVPESPTYLIKNKKNDEAMVVLSKLRGNFLIIDKEVEDIQNTLVNEKDSSFMDLFRFAVNRKAMYIIILTVLVWQFSGGTTMCLYLYIIVEEAHLQIDHLIPVVSYGVIQTISCLVSTVLIDWIGRKRLLLSSCVGSILTLLIMAGYFYFKNEGFSMEKETWIPILGLSLYVFFNNIGLGTIFTVYTSEVFAYNMQSYGGAVACAAYGIFGLITNIAFEIITEKVGMYGIFLLFAGCTFIGAVVLYYYVPETKNKSLIEIQEMLKGNSDTSNKTRTDLHIENIKMEPTSIR